MYTSQATREVLILEASGGYSMSASGSLATLGIAELLQVATLFRKRGSLCCTFTNNRVITIYFHDGCLGGLSDNGRPWQLGDLLESMGRLSQGDKFRLLEEARTRDKRLGQLLLDEGLLSREEMEGLLRRMIMQSLLFAIENEERGFFEFEIGDVSETSVMFPITDFLMELTTVADEFERLRSVLGPGALTLSLESTVDPGDRSHSLPYRLVQVLAHVDGQKTPMDVAAAAPFTPTETLARLCDLAERGYVVWARPGPREGALLSFPGGNGRGASESAASAEAERSVRMTT